MLACNYLAILASTSLAECEKFGGLQCLKSGYRDGQLEAVNEAWMQIDHVFATDE